MLFLCRLGLLKRFAHVPLWPVTSLEHQEGQRFFEMGPNILNYVQYFQTMSYTFFQQGRKFSRGGFDPLVTGLVPLFIKRIISRHLIYAVVIIKT